MDAPTDLPPAPGGAAGPTAPPGGPPGPRRLRRRPDEGPLAGVCAGVAHYFNVDPVIVRIAAVVLFFSGPGFFAYVLAWIFVPPVDADDGDRGGPFRAGADRTTQVFGALLVLLALSVLWDGWWGPGRRWLFPLALMALGAWLLLRPDRDAEHPTVPNPRPVAPDPPTPPPGDPLDATAVAAVPATADVTAPTSTSWRAGPPEPERTRRRRVLGPAVFGALLIWGGLAALTDVTLGTALAGALLLVGGGFVVGAFVGGSRALVVPAFLIALALAVVSAVDIPLRGPIGEHGWTPERVSDLADPFEVSMGQGTLDLTRVPLRDGDVVTVRASVGMGHLIVLVPDGPEVVSTTEVGAGEARVFQDVQSGVGFTRNHVTLGDPGAATLELELQVGLGQVEVRRAGPDVVRGPPVSTTTLG